MERSSVLAFFILFLISFFMGCDTLNDYKPKTAEEEAIKSTLVTYFDAWNKDDAGGVLSVVHEDAQMMVGSGRDILTKKQFAERLPERFKNAPKFEEGSPDMDISGDKATVTMPMRGSDFNLEFVIKLAKADDRWYIMSKAY